MFGRVFTPFLALALILVAAGFATGAQARGAAPAQDQVAASRLISHSHHLPAVDGGAAHPAGHVLCAADPCGSVHVVAAAGLALAAIEVLPRPVAFDARPSRAFVVSAGSNSALAHRRVTVLLI